MLHVAKPKHRSQESTMSLLELYCHVDTFCHTFLPQWDQQLRAHGQRCMKK